MIRPLVSVIIPTFNYGHLILETLTGLINQDYSCWEAVIIDDGSTDNTAEIVKEICLKDERIKYFYQENKGVSAARNLGLKHAEGEFIQFLDADDILSPQKINLQVDYMMKSPTLDITYCTNYYFRHPDRLTLFNNFSLNNGNTISPLLLNGKGFPVIYELLKRNLMICSPLFRKKVLETVKNFSEGIKYAEDHEFWFKCALHNYSFNFFDHALAYTMIRVHPDSVSQDSFSLLQGELTLRDNFPQMINENSALTQKQKLQLISLNKTHQMQLCKLMILQKWPLSKETMVQIIQTAGLGRFLICLVKALNEKRKNGFT